MNQNTVQQLPEQTIKLITSTQIVTSVGTAVKELFENAIDAGAKAIQVRLENYGLDLIEVKDDGSGISYENVQKMFLPGYTSKIRRYEDLDNLTSYGFRGEALAAICKIANISITTKTHLDTLAMTYDIDSTGLPLSSKPSHLNNGTVISVSNLFSKLPVRRLYLSSKKKISEELKKAEYIVQSLSLIHPELGVSLIHNKCPIWRKNSVKGVKQSFMQVAGLKVVSKMEYINKHLDQIDINLIVPKKNLENVDCVFSNSPLTVYVYVNKRPVKCKILSQPVQEHVFYHYSNSNITSKFAVCLISVDIPPQQMDVNLEPNKTKILLKNQIHLIRLIDEALKNYYGHENFTCTTLMSDSRENLVDEESESQPTKRARLAAPDKSVGEKRTEEFKDKNQDWDLEIINDDCAANSNLNIADVFRNGNASGAKEGLCQPQSLCSLINSNNCVLTREEVTELNTKLSESNHKLVVSTNSSNSETRLIDREDIQSRSLEKPILKEWPCRAKDVVEAQRTLTEAENKAVEEIAEEIEKSAEIWSTEMMKAVQGDRFREDGKTKDVVEEDINQFDLSMQSISSQMGKKEMKAFTKFARIMRPKISQEFPNINFTQVAGILADRWKALLPDEVKYYEKMADAVDINRKIHQETKQGEASKPAEKPKNSAAHKIPNLQSMWENLKRKNKTSRPPRPEVSLSISLNGIKQIIQKPHKTSEYDFKIIGKLQPSNNWLYIKGKEIGHVRHQGLQELIVSQKMLNNFSLPRKALEKTILVNEELMGTLLWNVLISLESEWDSSAGKDVITSDAVVKNGFRVEINKCGDAILSAGITEMAEAIPHFGISELKDALRMYQQNGEFGGLLSWRPTSICNYITNEAVRIAQQSVEPPDREEMEHMMNTYHLCFRHLPPVCLHSREIFPSIFSLENETPKIHLKRELRSHKAYCQLQEGCIAKIFNLLASSAAAAPNQTN